jgi:hypothetical protein
MGFGMNTQAYLALGLVICAGASAEKIKFEGSVGALPSGWMVAMTHGGGEPRWQIVNDPSAPNQQNVLAQLSQDRTAGRFPLAIWGGNTIRNGDVSVAFKTVSGQVDQAAGIVWRYQDADNYYIVRANALENNVVLYKVEKGVRLSIAPKGMPSRSYGVKRDVPKGQWNRLRIVFNDSHFVVYFNQQQVFETEDQTFKNAGRTGLWTKADSVTYFDDFALSGN